MEIGILQVASQIPAKIPSEKQSVILIDVRAKAALEGIDWAVALPSTSATRHRIAQVWHEILAGPLRIPHRPSIQTFP